MPHSRESGNPVAGNYSRTHQRKIPACRRTQPSRHTSTQSSWTTRDLQLRRELAGDALIPEGNHHPDRSELRDGRCADVYVILFDLPQNWVYKNVAHLPNPRTDDFAPSCVLDERVGNLVFQ